ncbi:hypothetical protein QR680_014412 [Steinernema hermaphroditum]|uniref:Uncharacterized protein n=1 Tax=Steinernema hermaphroditum TaxID=289476 RepID=A0AA39I8T9_9BILA|nr:hypothetical protein QR680_014412 [Steinernema hermaphroditum]
MDDLNFDIINEILFLSGRNIEFISSPLFPNEKWRTAAAYFEELLEDVTVSKLPGKFYHVSLEHALTPFSRLKTIVFPEKSPIPTTGDACWKLMNLQSVLLMPLAREGLTLQFQSTSVDRECVDIAKDFVTKVFFSENTFCCAHLGLAVQAKNLRVFSVKNCILKGRPFQLLRKVLISCTLLTKVEMLSNKSYSKNHMDIINRDALEDVLFTEQQVAELVGLLILKLWTFEIIIEVDEEAMKSFKLEDRTMHVHRCPELWLRAFSDWSPFADRHD